VKTEIARFTSARYFISKNLNAAFTQIFLKISFFFTHSCNDTSELFTLLIYSSLLSCPKDKNLKYDFPLFLTIFKVFLFALLLKYMVVSANKRFHKIFHSNNKAERRVKGRRRRRMKVLRKILNISYFKSTSEYESKVDDDVSVEKGTTPAAHDYSKCSHYEFPSFFSLSIQVHLVCVERNEIMNEDRKMSENCFLKVKKLF
jgi:hypothetical protein